MRKLPPAPTPPPATAHLQYFGGKVVQQRRIVQVLYGAGTYIPELTGTEMSAFYTQIATNGVWDWLSEYDTTSPAQTIGHGAFAGAVQIAPSAPNSGAALADAQIQAELAAQIGAGHLPAPTDNTIYMTHFPAGVSITQASGDQSCVKFCAYHSTFQLGAHDVFYGVMPDLSPGSGCDLGCGAATTFGNQTSVSSHELAETITDAEIGIATSFGPPLGWYDMTNGEIGDICNGQQDTFVGGDGVTYVIQQLWSNVANACITTRATGGDFALAIAPASIAIAPGGTATATIATTGGGGPIALAVTGLPGGVTGAIAPASVMAGSSATLTLSASAAAIGAATLTVTGTAGATSHAATATVTVGSTSALAVQITSPSDGATVTPSFVVAASASGGAVEAALAIDGTVVATSTAQPFQFQTPRLGAGAHDVQVGVVDAAKNLAVAEIHVVVGAGDMPPPDPLGDPGKQGCSAGGFGGGGGGAVVLVLVVVVLVAPPRRRRS